MIMQILEDIKPLFQQLEESEYFGDEKLRKSLSIKIYRHLKNAAEELMLTTDKYIDAANIFLTCSEFIQEYNFLEAVIVLEKAIEMLKITAGRARQSGDYKLAGSIYKMIADIFREKFNDMLTAVKYFKRSKASSILYLEISKKKGYSNIYTQYYNLAELSYHAYQWDDVDKYCHLTMQEAEGEKKYFMIAMAYKLLLQAYAKNNDRKSIIETFLEARKFFMGVLEGLTISSKIRNYMEIADVYHVFASFYDIIRDLEGFNNISLKEAYCYMNVANQYEHVDDLITSAIYSHGAGLVFKRIEKIKDALDAFLTAADKFELMEIFDSSADNYIQAGDCFELKGNYHESIKMNIKAARMYQVSGFLELGIQTLYKTLNLVKMVDTEYETIESLRETILTLLMELIEEHVQSMEGREAAYPLVEIAFLLFKEQGFDYCHPFLKQALDTFKANLSLDPDINIANCSDLAAIIIISIILERVGDIKKYLSLLQRECQKMPAGRKYHAFIHMINHAWKQGKQIPAEVQKSRLVFNIPVLKWLTLILIHRMHR